MEEQKDRCIVVIVNGKKYEAQFGLVKNRLTAYAKKCKADLKVLSSLPSEFLSNSSRDAFSWKLLVPILYKQYELVLFLDLDLFISTDCPDVFGLMPENVGLMARLSDRDDIKYKRAWAEYPRVLSETVQQYFENNGFEYSDRCLGDINGGVLLFRPKLVADIYRKFWESNTKTSDLYGGDEPALAYLAMSNGLFYPLEEKFNYEVIYAISRVDHKFSYLLWKSRCYAFICKVVKHFTGVYRFILGRSVLSLIDKMIRKKECFICHFSGGFWTESCFKKLDKRYPYICID